MSKKPSIWDELTDPQDGGKKLKAVFDHVRNYTIVGVLCGAGVFGFKNADTHPIWGLLDKLSGGLLIILALGLFTLNYGTLVRVLADTKFSRFKPLSLCIYLVLGYIAFSVFGSATEFFIERAIKSVS